MSGPRLISGPRAGLAAALGTPAALVLLAFATTGGFDSSITVSAANTWAEIVIVLLGAGACAAALLLGGRGGRAGAIPVALFALLAAFTALSIAWSVQPENSWQAANLTLAYLAAFAGAAALARLAPGRWPTLVAAIGIVMVVVSAYALLSKVFPGSLAASDTGGRLQAPLGYWNATGAAAVLGLAPCLWGWCRRPAGTVLRGLTVPGAAILIAVVVLSYSRIALLVAVLVLGGWLLLVPARLRSVALIVMAGVGAAVIVGWALARPGLTADGVTLPQRSAAGHPFGIVLALVLAVLAGVSIAVARAGDRRPVPEPIRRRIGIVLLAGLALLPALGVAALASSSRGLSGEISHAWSSLTSTSSGIGVGNNPSRIGQLGSTRPLYWSQGITVGEHALLKGVGALGYATARTRYTTNPAIAEHAHSYLVQTFADLGLLGLAINLALLVAWGRSAAGALGGRRPWRTWDGDAAAERTGLVTMLLVVVAFGLLSASDWTWFFPGVSVPALLAAGWLAGRGPLATPVGGPAERVPLSSRPGAAAAVAALAALALLGAWLVWQPLRAADAGAAAITAAGAGDTRTAFADARDAAAADPVSLQPLLILASFYADLGDRVSARAELEQAVALQPENRDSWLALGSFDLRRGHPRQALPSLERAVALDPTVPATVDTLAAARAALNHRAH